MALSSSDVKRMVTALMATVTSIERAKRRGLASQLTMLQAIASRKRAVPSALSDELGLHQSSITRQVQSLERSGLVKVTANPADGRSCLVELTKAGRAELRQLTKFGLQRFALFVADWDAEEVRTMTRLLHKFESSKAEVASRDPQPPARSWRTTNRQATRSAAKN
jgi:DNA-binding MarR family transcriptional regulator